MKEVYQVTFDVKGNKIPILFDTKDTAERTINAVMGILNKEGKKSVKYECEIIKVHSAENVLTMAETLFSKS